MNLAVEAVLFFLPKTRIFFMVLKKLLKLFFFGHIQIAVKVGLSVRASLDKTAETTQDTRLSLFMAANFVGVEVGTYTEHWLSVIPTAECF